MLRPFLACLLTTLGLPARAQRAEPLSAQDAQATFQLADPALRVELVASEPLVESPCAFAFDETGRLFVAENRGYPNTSEPRKGRIALLRDTDGDGRMDDRVTFAEGLTFPNGVLPWRGGVIVTCAPDVLFLRDTDGDGRADEKRVMLTGFSTTGSTQLRVNAPTLGLDGWVYLAAGLSSGSITAPTQPERPALKMTADVRFHPDTLEVESVDGRSQYGMSFDDFGRRFICMNRLPVQHVVLASRWLRRNPNLAFSDTVQDCHERDVKTGLRGGGDGVRLHPISSNVTTADSHAGSFSAACGVFVWPGGALGARYAGAVFSCDPTGNLVHADRLEERGATFTARPRFADKEFLASRDDWFRPVYLASGPDGALYIADMVRRVIEHPDYLPEEVRKRTDFESGKALGRIWRVRAGNAETKVFAKLADDSGARIAALAHEHGWQRQNAFRLLLQKGSDGPASNALREALAGNTPVAQSAILHLLAARGALDPEALQAGANAGDAALREVVLKLWMENESAREWLPDPAVLGNEPNARARLMAALGLGEIPEGTAALASIAAKDVADRWTRAAVLSSIGEREAEFVTAFAEAARTIGAEEMEVIRGAGRAFPGVEALQSAFGDPSKVLENPRIAMALALGALERFSKRIESVPEDGWLIGVLRFASELVPDESLPAGERAIAIGFLARMPWGRAGEPLLRVAQSAKTEDTRLAALRAVATFPNPEVSRTLLTSARWKAATPAQREALLEALLAHSAHVTGVLDAVADGRIPANAIPAARRNALLKHKQPEIAARAKELFGAVDGNRQAAFEAAKAALALPANPGRGRELFQQYCATCHRLDRAGHAVGPDLLDIRNQTKENILFHVVVPDAEIAPAFTAYLAEAKDGRALSGILTSETGTSVTLRGPLAQDAVLLRSDIKSLAAMPSSLMPAGLEQAMSKQDLADLVAYLKGE